MRTLNKFVAILASSFLLAAGGAHATVIYSLDQSFFGGAIPVGPISGPYATATFQQNGVNNVTLTLSTANVTNFSSITNWNFNYLGNASTLSIVNTSGIRPVAARVADTFYAGNSGFYDIQFNYASSYLDTFFGYEFFTPNNTSVFNISGTGLLESDFIALSDGRFSGGSYNTAATVSVGESSAYLANTPAVAAPEPATYLSLATILALGAGLARRKVKAHKAIQG